MVSKILQPKKNSVLKIYDNCRIPIYQSNEPITRQMADTKGNRYECEI